MPILRFLLHSSTILVGWGHENQKQLVTVTGKICFVNCLQCGDRTAIGDGAEVYRKSPAKADLNGEPFKAYYRLACCSSYSAMNGVR